MFPHYLHSYFAPVLCRLVFLFCCEFVFQLPPIVRKYLRFFRFGYCCCLHFIGSPIQSHSFASFLFVYVRLWHAYAAFILLLIECDTDFFPSLQAFNVITIFFAIHRKKIIRIKYNNHMEKEDDDDDDVDEKNHSTSPLCPIPIRVCLSALILTCLFLFFVDLHCF